MIVHLSSRDAEYLGKWMTEEQVGVFLRDNGYRLRFSHGFQIMGRTWEILCGEVRVGYAYFTHNWSPNW